MPFCPTCGSEYRTEFTECADCKVALVAEKPGNDPPPKNDTPFVVLYRSNSQPQLNMLAELLSSQGIEVMADDSSMGMQGFEFGTGGGVLRVREDRLEEAQSIIADKVEVEKPERQKWDMLGSTVSQAWWWVGFIVWFLIVVVFLPWIDEMAMAGLIALPLVIWVAVVLFGKKRKDD